MVCAGRRRWVVTQRQRCDLEMLLIGAFSPLTGFLSQADYEHVLLHSRLRNQSLWPMPITLDVTEAFARQMTIGEEIDLYDADGTTLARMTITDRWCPDKKMEAEKILMTQEVTHPGVHYLFHTAGPWYLGGPVQSVTVPQHHDFTELRYTPRALKQAFLQLGWKKIIGFQTRNPMHRAHMELTLRAAEAIEGHILLHPAVGFTKPGDIDYVTRVHCYKKILRYYPIGRVMLALLPLAMRMAGPKEALWHALIRKNYGCTHFIIGRDHAGPGNNAQHQPFYEPDAASHLVGEHAREIGMTILPFQEMMYVKERKAYAPLNEIGPSETALTISGTQLRERLLTDQVIPDWFSFPEIIQELRDADPPKYKQGFTLFFTGLSGSGKTTLANALVSKLRSEEKRRISLLDGDLIRQLLGEKLGFSRADRNLNIHLISLIAAEITKVRGIAICAAIAPYHGARQNSRQLIAPYGGFIQIYNATPLAVCEVRDPKGLYAKARAGELKNMTGVDDPYEVPEDADLMIDTSTATVEESVAQIMKFLYESGYVKEPLFNTTQPLCPMEHMKHEKITST